jgi:hypothetical protein
MPVARLPGKARHLLVTHEQGAIRYLMTTARILRSVPPHLTALKFITPGKIDSKRFGTGFATESLKK